tara:strand:- start:265 stop:417 length:153 start_codon:yes stop_codon:yes gene_type:complete
MKSRYNKNGKLIRHSWTSTISVQMQKELDKKFLEDIKDIVAAGRIGNKES